MTDLANTVAAHAAGRADAAAGRSCYENPYCQYRLPSEWHAWTLGLYGLPAPTMTRAEAYAAARAQADAHSKARVAHLFRGAAEVDEASFGYRHGWYKAGGFNFRSDELYPECAPQPIMD